MKKVFAIAALTIAGCTVATAQVRQVGPVTIYDMPQRQGAIVPLDYQNAKPIPLPMARRAPQFTSVPNLGKLGFSPGSFGSAGGLRAVQMIPPVEESVQGSQSVAPQEYGTSNHVFTTSRVQGYNAPTNIYYPYRAAGKLFFTDNGGSYVCSAALIKRGVVVTAAHCVSKFGQSRYYNNFQFVPAYDNGNAPYGVWVGKTAMVLTSYYNGSDSCAEAGIVCRNDVAVISLFSDSNNTNAGDLVGFYSYAYNGYGFVNGNAMISQLGYPVALDNGGKMQRTDSTGFVSSADSNNTVIGSLQTGGSSGGPWVINIGKEPALNGTSFGSGANHNVIVGTTSWGYTSTTVKEQGASPFTDQNIEVLVNNICGLQPNKC